MASRWSASMRRPRSMVCCIPSGGSPVPPSRRSGGLCRAMIWSTTRIGRPRARSRSRRLRRRCGRGLFRWVTGPAAITVTSRGGETQAAAVADGLARMPSWMISRAFGSERSFWMERGAANGLGAWRVTAVEPNRLLVLFTSRTPLSGREVGYLVRRPLVYFDCSWTFVLEPGAADGTRLLVRTRVRTVPSWIIHAMAVLRLGDTVMQRAMLNGIKRRAETVQTGASAGVRQPQSSPAVVRNSIEINSSPEAAFDCLSDLRQELEWNEALLAVESLTEGPLRAGSKYRARFKRVGDSVIEYLDYQRPRLWVTRSSNPRLDAGLVGKVTPTSEGCRVDLETQLVPYGMLALARPLLARIMAASWDRHLAAIKSQLEQQTSTSP